MSRAQPGHFRPCRDIVRNQPLAIATMIATHMRHRLRSAAARWGQTVVIIEYKRRTWLLLDQPLRRAPRSVRWCGRPESNPHSLRNRISSPCLILL